MIRDHFSVNIFGCGERIIEVLLEVKSLGEPLKLTQFRPVIAESSFSSIYHGSIHMRCQSFSHNCVKWLFGRKTIYSRYFSGANLHISLIGADTPIANKQANYMY